DVERRRELPEALGRRTGHGLGEREIRDVLRLAEVARPKELRQHDELRTARGRVANQGLRLREVLVRRLGHRHLHKTDRKAARSSARHRAAHTRCSSRSMLRESQYVFAENVAM